MRLHEGEEAPDFSVLDVYGKPVRLSDYKNQLVLICFLRYAGCPYCQLLLKKLALSFPRYEQIGLKIIAFSQSPKGSVIKYMGRYDLPFPIVADPEESIYKLYGVGSSFMGVVKGVIDVPKLLDTFMVEKMKQGTVDGDFFLMPGYFLIGPPETTIKRTHYATSFSDDDILKEVDKFLLEMN